MRAAFWRFAHKRYHMRAPTRFADVAALMWATLFILVYGGALLAGWRPDATEAFIGLVLTGVPLTFGVLHRRIQIEVSKAPDALYRKRLETNR